jgi:hypothetical protein
MKHQHEEMTTRVIAHVLLFHIYTFGYKERRVRTKTTFGKSVSLESTKKLFYKKAYLLTMA